MTSPCYIANAEICVFLFIIYDLNRKYNGNLAKKENTISDHTNISVSAKVISDVDASGKKVMNYLVRFTYTVDPQFSAKEDFAAGKYKAEESPAAASMLKIVKKFNITIFISIFASWRS